MLIAGLLLAVTAAATPSPTDRLAQLKTIAIVRTTPACTALRERVGPAIASIIDNDAKIASGRPIFGSMYNDDVVMHSDLRMSFDVLHMENLITPIARNISTVKNEIALLPKDRALDPVRERLQAIVDSQNDALNVLSGFVSTYQLGELQGHNSLIGPAAPGNAALSPQPPPGAPGASTVLNSGLPAAPGAPKPPSEQGANVTLSSSPYVSFADQLADIRKKQDAAERAASDAVLAAVDQCVTPKRH